MRVLITGGAGFIGSHTCDRFLREGHEVHAVDDLSTGSLGNLHEALQQPSFRFTEIDIVGPELAELVTAVQPEVVVHLAAQMDVRKSVSDPLADARVNVLGTVRLLAAASRSGTGRVVFASSGGTVYGEPDLVPIPETAPLRPLSPYGAAKVAGEAYVSAFTALYGMQHCILALGNVYGPRQDPHGEAGVVAIFAQALNCDLPTYIYGDGSSVRDYVYIDDVVDALLLASCGNGDGHRLIVGTGRGTSVKDLHTLMAAAVGTATKPGYRPARTGELARVVLNVSAAEERMGWTPRVGLEEGLARTLDWVRSGWQRPR